MISGLTLVSRILGLLRDAICLRYFGAGIWHYFTLAFMIPNLFRRLFGEGALSAALIPIYTEKLQQDEKAAHTLAQAVVTLLIMLLAGLTLLGLGFIYLYWHWSDHQYKTWLVLCLAAIMLPYMILICTVAVIGGLLNVHRHFAAPAAAPILLNLCIIASIYFLTPLFGVDRWNQIFAVAVAVIIAGIMQLLLQYPALKKAKLNLNLNFHFANVGLNKLFKLMAPMVLGLSVVQINTLMDSLIAFFFSATPESGPTFTLLGREFTYPVIEGSLSYLYCAQRLYQFPLGIFAVALATAIFPLLSVHAVQNDLAAFSKSLRQGLRMVFFISLPATVGIILIRTPLVRIIFEGKEFTSYDTSQTAWTLLFYSLGIASYSLQQIVVRAYYSFQDSVTPVKVALYMVGLNFILNLILIWFLATGGLALATAICATIQVSILLVLLIKRYRLVISKGIKASILKTTAATAIMGAGCRLTINQLADTSDLLQLLAVLTVSFILYIAVSIALKNTEFHALLKRK
jgi:putative peptidoglycan lipid II flippase